MTYLQLIETSEKYLNDKGLSKSIILQIIYGLDESIRSLTDIADRINDEIEGEMLKKILDGLHDHVENKKPISYITHSNIFCGHKFIVDDDVLPPRLETQEWTKILIDIIRDYGELEVLDMCCGTGVIGLTVKKELPHCCVTLTDISKEAVVNTKKNAKAMNLDVTVINSNLFAALSNKRYDVFVCNPPYVNVKDIIDDSVAKFEPYNAIYAPNRGLWFYENILKNIKKHLNEKYLIMMEIGFNLGGEITKLVKKYLGVEPEIYVDSDFNDRVVVVNRL